MRVLIVTDAFPPICGGSGWSTYELAKGLRACGHDVLIVRPRVTVGRSISPAVRRVHPGEAYDGFEPIEFQEWAPRVPFLRNYFKNERLYRILADFLLPFVRDHRIDVVHAQHLMSGPASIVAARAAGTPVVCTIRDYWPVCYWSDLIVDRSSAALCPACTVGRMTQCVRPHAGMAWPLALPAIPYMRANLSLKRARLAEADAIIAVSGAIARDLRVRAAELVRTRIEIIHNPVDVASLRADAASLPRPMAGPYALFVGKLEPNKGVGHLIPAVRRAALRWPLVVVGDGTERGRIETAARACGQEAVFTGWLPRRETLAWLRHAELLVFPSHGPESLSRVLIEASALGVPIAAMNTGGTGDIVVHEETGLLSDSVEELGEHVRRLIEDRVLAASLADAARRTAESRFSADVVVGRIASLYEELIAARGHARAT